MPSELELKLPFNYDVQSELVDHLIRVFLLHILYIRSVIPSPFPVFQEEAQALEHAVKLNGNERKIIKFNHEIEQLLLCTSLITKKFRVSSAIILLGPSANNPKEVYELLFQPYIGSVKNEINEKRLAAAKRRLVHQLINYQSSERSCSPLTKTNVFVALNVNQSGYHEEQHLIPVSLPGGEEERMEIEETSNFEASIPRSIVQSSCSGIPLTIRHLQSRALERADDEYDGNRPSHDIFQCFSYCETFRVRERKKVAAHLRVVVMSKDTVEQRQEDFAAPCVETTTGSSVPTAINDLEKSSVEAACPEIGDTALPADIPLLTLQELLATIPAAVRTAGTSAACVDSSDGISNSDRGVYVGNRWLVSNKGIKSIN